VQKSKRSHFDAIRSKLSESNSQNPSTYWNIWKSIKPRTVNNSTLSLKDFERYFKDQVAPPKVAYFDQEHMQEIHALMDEHDYNDLTDSVADEIGNAVITEGEIKVHLNKLKNNKASGSDGIVG